MIARNAHLKAMGVDVWVRRGAAEAGAEAVVAGTAGPSVSLPELEVEVRACTRCELHSTRTNTVFGAGNTGADWMKVENRLQIQE